MNINILVLIVNVAFFILLSFLMIKFYKRHIQNLNNHIEPIESKIENEILSNLKKVEDFAKNAKFFTAIGKWKGHLIHKHILFNGHVYEFFDTLPEFPTKIIFNDDEICFNQLHYKKTLNLENFGISLKKQ